ncbi:hypothetical protein BH09PSE6_BH09PSE6_00690 [soil metagenome]
MSRAGFRGAARAVLLSICVAASTAAPAQTSVQLKIETGGSAGLHRSIAEDARRDRLYSVGDDRTIRVWRRSDLRLIDVWFAPIAQAQPLEGELFATSLSPDGGTLAVGGWTGHSFGKSFCVYLFETRLGTLSQRVCGLADAVGTLRYTVDGRALLIGLLGRGGLQVMDTTTRAIVATDLAYNDSILGIDIGPANEIYTVAIDGALRRYGADFVLQGRIPSTGAQRAARVRIDPTGERIAVGYQDAAALTIYSARTGEVIDHVDAPAALPVKQMVAAVWSDDGQRLQVGATLASGEASVLTYRGSPLKFVAERRVGRKRFYELARLSRGDLGFTLEDGRVGVLPVDGEPRLTLDNGVPDFADAANAFTVDARGDSIGVALGPASMLQFRADRATARIVDRAAAAATAPMPAWFQWRQGSDEYSIDGRRARFTAHEELISVLTLSDGAILVGTDWALYEVRRTGEPRTIARFNAPVRQIRYAPETRLIVAGFGDGRVRWLRRADGRELLSLFVHLPTQEWVAWTPSGYYASSPRGDELVGWVVTRDGQHEAEYYRAVQFERDYYQPQLIRAALGAAAAPALDVKALLAIAPPRVRILDIAATAGSSETDRATTLTFSALRGGLPMLGVSVYVDDLPVIPAQQRPLASGERDRIERVLRVPAVRADSIVRVEVITDRSIGFAEALAPALPRRAAPKPGVLRVLAVGINTFPGLPQSLDLDLELARKDASDMARQFQSGGEGLYQAVQIRTLSDAVPGGASKAALMQALTMFEQAGPDDTSVIFMASHGATDVDGNFWFVPSDAGLADFCALVDTPGATVLPECRSVPKSASNRFSTLVAGSSIFDGLRAAAGRRVLIIDTCEARGVVGGTEIGSLRKRSASSRFTLMLAAAAGESSQEYKQGGNGLFTYSLLSALRGAADLDADRRISIHEAFDYAQTLVERLRDRRAGPMTPSLIAPASQIEQALLTVHP